MKITDPHLRNGISYAYIMSIDAYLALLNNSLYTSIHYLDEETADIIQHLEHFFLDLKNIFSPNTDRIKCYGQELLNSRKILEKKYQVLKAYQRELHHVTTYYYFTQNTDNNKAFSDTEIKSLRSDCVHFIFSDLKTSEVKRKTEMLLPYIPIRMTQENYLAYIQKSLAYMALSSPHLKEYALPLLLNQLFDGHHCTYFGKSFKDIADMLNTLKEESSIKDFDENVELLEEMLEDSILMIETLYQITGCFYSLLLVDDLDFENLADLHMSFGDLYHTLKAILSSDENKALFLETLTERVDEIKTVLQISYDKILPQVQSDSLWIKIHPYLSTALEYLFSFNTQKQPTDDIASLEILQDFANQLSKHLDALPVVEKKLRMQYFISKIPFIMSEKIFKSYIEKAFSIPMTSVQNFTPLIYIRSILEENK